MNSLLGLSVEREQRIATESRDHQGTRPPRVLVIDVGGSSYKMKASEHQDWKEFPSGRWLEPHDVLESVRKYTERWDYDVVTIGVPAPVVFGHIIEEPPNLSHRGWVGFNFQTTLARPTKVTNDAILQAVGSYRGGSMLFVGLGTGVGCAMIVDGIVQLVSLNGLTYIKKKGYDKYLSRKARKKLGQAKWENHVHRAIGRLRNLLQVEYVVIGGGSARKLKRVPAGAILAPDDAAFIGGRRLWELDSRDWWVPRNLTHLTARDHVIPSQESVPRARRHSD